MTFLVAVLRNVNSIFQTECNSDYLKRRKKTTRPPGQALRSAAKPTTTRNPETDDVASFCIYFARASAPVC